MPCIDKLKFHLARSVTLSSPCLLAWGKVVTTRVALVGQHGVTRSSRQVRLAPHSVDWGGHVPLFPVVVPEIDANPELKKLNLYTRKHYCFLVVRHVGTTTARHARHDVRDTTRFTHHVVL